MRNLYDIYDADDIALVDRLFAEADAEAGPTKELCNPIDGGRWIKGLDPVRPQKERALQALAAYTAFELQRPPDAPALPLSYGDREDLKGTGRPIDYITSLFARSWVTCKYGPEHPPFDRYVAGALASGLLPDAVARDADLVRRYPPAPLEGMGGGCIWRAPKQRRR